MRNFIIIVLLAVFAAIPAAAQDNEAQVQTVIERLTEAYGGESLTGMTSVAISSNRKLAWPGQGQTAGFVEFEDDRLRKHFDLVNEWGSMERWTHQNGNVYHNRFVVTADGATALDYFERSATRSERGGFWQWFNVDFRSSDALLAYRLATGDVAVEHRGTATYGGNTHDLLEFAVYPETQALVAYVSRRDGLIHRITMDREIGAVNLIFSNHRESGGVRYASSVHTYLGDTLTKYDEGLHFIPNADVTQAIAIEAGFSPPAEPVEMSEMTVEEIAAGAFVVGQGDYGLFALHDGGVIAVNAYAGLKDRYEAFIAHIGQDLPLSGVIVTHHHSDHMDAVPEAVELGATLYLTPESHAALELDSTKVQILSPDDTVGPFSVFVRGTSHASENAFVYHAASKALFQDDHYHGLIADGPTRVQPSAMEIHRIIEGLGIDVAFLISGHSRKAERWETFLEAMQKPESGELCPSQRDICRS